MQIRTKVEPSCCYIKVQLGNGKGRYSWLSKSGVNRENAGLELYCFCVNRKFVCVDSD